MSDLLSTRIAFVRSQVRELELDVMKSYSVALDRAGYRRDADELQQLHELLLGMNETLARAERIAHYTERP